MHVKEEAGEPDRRAPPAEECHVCSEDFKFLSVMDRFERVIFLWQDLGNCRYFHYTRHYQEMAQRPFQDANHTAVEEKVFWGGNILPTIEQHYCTPMKIATQLIIDPSRCFRHPNIGGIQIFYKIQNPYQKKWKQRCVTEKMWSFNLNFHFFSRDSPSSTLLGQNQ